MSKIESIIVGFLVGSIVSQIVLIYITHRN